MIKRKFTLQDDLSFRYECPEKTPSGSKPILLRRNRTEMASSRMAIGTYEYRMVCVRLWLWAKNYIADYGDDLITMPTTEFKSQVLLPHEIHPAIHLTIGRVLHLCSQYKMIKAIRIRSGVKNPISKRHKQHAHGNKYVIHSAYDVLHMMEYQMSVWYPWFASVNGETGPWNMDRFNEVLSWIYNGDPVRLMTDMLAFKDEVGEENSFEPDHYVMTGERPNREIYGFPEADLTTEDKAFLKPRILNDNKTLYLKRSEWKAHLSLTGRS